MVSETLSQIISLALFEAVQRSVRMKESLHKRKIEHDFPFTGIFRSGESGMKLEHIFGGKQLTFGKNILLFPWIFNKEIGGYFHAKGACYK